MDWTRFRVLFACISYVSSTIVHYNARVTVKSEDITRFSFENKNISLVKLVGTSGNKHVWVGGEDSLYSIKPRQDTKAHKVDVTLCKKESKDSDTTHYPYRISLLREGVDSSLLFICRSYDGNTVCCNMASNHTQHSSFTSDNYEPDINEPSLLVGNMLYFTKPKKGLYRINRDDKTDNMWPQSTEAEQIYLKLIAGKGQHKDKVYSFIREKVTQNKEQKSKEVESEQWIPRVSQSCMNDKGGSKNNLQNSWTSMIYARLFCGREYEFTQMIDVATLETDNDTKIYALFRNYWNMSAVCVYDMNEISTVFTSSQFSSTKVPANHKPGKCVDDSTSLSSEALMFMKDRPELKNWVMPVNGPLLFRHHHYTHIQVDRVRGHTVLLLSLENGRIHKVLEERVEEPVFVIAEYLPFPQKTHITSMLLDASGKHLYVSSSNEVAQIDLQTCHLYGDECNSCRLSRDPYCGLEGSRCTSTAIKPATDIECNMPAASPSKTETGDKLQAAEHVHVLLLSKHFLRCHMTSHHATYHWRHEGGHKSTIVQFQLSMIRSDALRLTPALLLLLTASHVLLLNLFL
ncbi:hypothetical protein QQF64_012796 [Cirrhinus molitorella]|uniref:Sema domain-containing protein n=1 Tax=Cirrhinus molitorella TaxID=172907 RepID=A0ABR3LZ02_9TELE